MNTIPTIFNEKITPYTAVGGKERIASTGISAVVINRQGFPRRTFFSDLEKTGFDNIISIESCTPHYDIEDLSGRFPFVRFILPENNINLGEQINLAASEVDSPLFFILRNDMKIIAGGTARRMAERLVINAKETEDNSILSSERGTGFKRLCTVPVIMNSNYEILPSLTAPMTHKRKIRTVYLEPHTEGDLSLFPFDGIGIYDRQRFIHMGGFDTTLQNPLWQLLDFGFRSHLWGEEISLNLQLRLIFDGALPAANYTVEDNYRRFYLKNLAPVFRSDYAHLPLYRFFSYFGKSGEDLITAWKQFKETRRWVAVNKYRWRYSAHNVTDKWDVTRFTNDQN